MKKTIVIILIICVLIIISWLVYDHKKTTDRLTYNCRFIDGFSERVDDWFNTILECYGYLYIGYTFQEKYFTLTDRKNNQSIAEVESPDDINLVGEKIYLKTLEHHYSYFYLKGEYFYSYFDGNDIIQIETDSIDKLPKYLVVDIMTEAITAYVDFEDIPVEERANFKVK